MKKISIVFLILLTCLIGGCEAIEDAADITFYITYNTIFDISENSHTYEENIDLTDDDDYQKYSGKIKKVEIEYVKYSISSNTGNGGYGRLFANSFGGSYSSSTEVAEMVSFSAGELRDTTAIKWLDQGYLESLLTDGKMTVWAIGEGQGVHILAPTEFKFKIVANPLN